MIENGNEYSCNDNSSYDDVELMETLVCCDDNGAWSELVSSCSSIYEHDATPEKNNQVGLCLSFFTIMGAVA